MTATHTSRAANINPPKEQGTVKTRTDARQDPRARTRRGSVVLAALAVCFSILFGSTGVATASETSSTSGGPVYIVPGTTSTGSTLCKVYMPSVRGIDLTSGVDKQVVAYRPIFHHKEIDRWTWGVWVWGVAQENSYTNIFYDWTTNTQVGYHPFHFYAPGTGDIYYQVQWKVNGKWSYADTVMVTSACQNLVRFRP